MEQIGPALLGALAWAYHNPAAAFVAVVTFLSALVAAYHRSEPAIKRYVQGTTETWDDRALARVDAFFRGLDWFIGLAKLFLPGMVDRARRPDVPPPTRPRGEG